MKMPRKGSIHKRMRIVDHLKSDVWRFFLRVDFDPTKSICNLCGKVLSNGSSMRSSTTSNMWKHLAAHHQREYGQIHKLAPSNPLQTAAAPVVSSSPREKHKKRRQYKGEETHKHTTPDQSSDVADAGKAFLGVLFGPDNYRNWMRLKKKLNHDDNRTFVNWLLSVGQSVVDGECNMMDEEDVKDVKQEVDFNGIADAHDDIALPILDEKKETVNAIAISDNVTSAATDACKEQVYDDERRGAEINCGESLETITLIDDEDEAETELTVDPILAEYERIKRQNACVNLDGGADVENSINAKRANLGEEDSLTTSNKRKRKPVSTTKFSARGEDIVKTNRKQRSETQPAQQQISPSRAATRASYKGVKQKSAENYDHPSSNSLVSCPNEINGLGVTQEIPCERI